MEKPIPIKPVDTVEPTLSERIRKAKLMLQAISLNLEAISADVESGNISQPQDNERLIKCPYCDFDCVHMESVTVNRGGEVTNIDANGTKMTSEGTSGRGARIEIVYWCESGHKWRKSYQFHKGSIEVSNDLMTTVEGPPDYGLRDLWRD